MMQEHAPATQAPAGEPIDIGGLMMHHTADAAEIDLQPFATIHLPHWPDIHIGPVTMNLSPTKHVVFMILAAALVFLSMRLVGRTLEKQRANEVAPKGIANMMEAFVLWVREEICIVNIGREKGPAFAPFIMTIFFFILYGNMLGLVPWGASFTGNLGVTTALAAMAFVTIEIGGMRALGFNGYMRTIFPKVEGMSGAGAAVISVAMAPIEILGKLVKPFALCFRLFGNMTAGHFVVLALFGMIFLFGNLEVWRWAIGLSSATLVLGIMMLEIIVAFVQAYVFAIITAVLIGMMQHAH
jgi:F-type H+-transporting ATPase subunit a